MENKKTILLAAVVALLLLAIAGFSLSITQIEVTGNGHYTKEEIKDILFGDSVSRNVLVCMVKDRFFAHEEIPFVEDYDIIFRSLRRVEVMVYEKSLVGYVSYMSSYMYFDKDGIIVESANRALEGIPRIDGLSFGQITLYEELPVTDQTVFQEILNLTQILSLYDFEVDRIQYNRFGEATLYMGEIEVVLGSNDNLNGKISELNDMLPQLADLRGVLYLDSYDEASSAGYPFEPR